MNSMNAFFKQMWTSGDVVFIFISALLLYAAIAVGVCRQYHLMAGVNTTPKKELEKYDLTYIGRYFAIFTGILGVIFFIEAFLFTYFQVAVNWRVWIILGQTATYAAWMILYGHIKKDRIYKNSNPPRK